MSVQLAAWVCFAFALGSFAQAMSGFGFALISIPLATVFFNTTDAVVMQTLAGLVMSCIMAYKYRDDADWQALRWILPTSLVGIGIGLSMLDHVSNRGLRFGVGIAVLCAAIAIATGFRLRLKTEHAARGLHATSGLVSGMLAATTGTNGPPLVIALASRDAEPAPFRATLQVAFAFANIAVLPLFLAKGKISHVGVIGAGIALVPTMIGRIAGERVFATLDKRRFRSVVLTMLFLAAFVALFKAAKG